MKKILFVLTVLIAATTIHAQCTPDLGPSSPGIYPDSATGFSDACVNVPYSQIITNIVPADTTLLVFGFPVLTTIDSIVIDNVTGLPTGLSIACNPNGCAFLGGTTGCAIISGTTTTTGNYPLVFNLSAYIGGTGTPNAYLVDYYSIDVLAVCVANIASVTNSTFQLLPNPAIENISIQGLNTRIGTKSIELINLDGKTLISIVATDEDKKDISLSSYESGVYFIRISHESGSELLKFIKE